MKVVSVIGSISARNGGPGINLVGSAPKLRKLGIDLEIVTTTAATGSTTGAIRRMAAEDFPAGSSEVSIRLARALPPHRLNFAPGIHRSLGRALQDADVVRIHGLYLYPNLAGYLEARRRNIPYVVSPHGVLDPYIQTRNARMKTVFDHSWQARVMNEAHAVHATSEDEAAHVREAFPRAKVTVIPNGLDLQAFADPTGGSAFRAQWLDGWRGPVITCLGRLSHKKGLDTMIAAFAELRKSVDARLLIVGSDDENLQPTLIEQAGQLGVEQSVVFTGPLYGADRLAALDSTTVWALPSRGENFGNAVVEAMAAGCPVVISPEVGISKSIGPERAGVVAQAEPHVFAAAILDLLQSPTRTAALGAEGRAFVARYDWNIVGVQMRDLFTSAAHTQESPHVVG